MADLLIKDSQVCSIKAIIFDKDGTLSDSEENLLELAKTRIDLSVNKFRKLKINEIKVWLLKKLLSSVYGLQKTSLSADETLAIATREHNIVSTASIFSLFGFNWFKSLSLAQEVFEEVDTLLTHRKDKIPQPRIIIPGALDLLLSLKKEGVIIALMSNDTEKGIEEFIYRNKLKNIFDNIWSAEDKPSKPNPKAVIELCKKMNYDPSESAFISDADTDLKMAKEAGINAVIGFTGGWKIPPSLTETKLLITKFHELLVQSNN